ncbi:MAG: hypothetical protein ACEY3M_12875 [Wolbachia sp.]|uniref:hypothetical protein n=1 Tax=Wolbachia endosymbiont (group A) of Ennomos erosarius TaxID=3066174 RepID=UPI003342BEA6
MVEIKSSGSQCLGTGMTPFFFLDSSVKHWNDTEGATGMTPFWMEISVSYSDDTLLVFV